MTPTNFKTLIAAAAVSLVALGPAAGTALAEKPQAGPPSQAQASRYARGNDRGQGNGAQGQSRGRADDGRGSDRNRGGDARGRDRGPGGEARGNDWTRGGDARGQGANRGGDTRSPPAARSDDRRGPPSAPPPRYERRDDGRSHYAARGGDSRNFQDHRRDDRRDGDRYRGGDRRYDSRGGDSRHYVRPVYQPAQYRPAKHRHYTYYDTRYNHRHYYPPRGHFYPHAPRNAVVVHHHHHRYYYGGGIWYAPRGAGWVVVAPPVGVFVSLLPTYYSTVWFGGIPYYYANDVYYVYRERERVYQVVEPPYGAQATTVSLAAEEIYVYPREGQSQEQTDFDRYECHRWAADETGFDPTRPDGGVGADQARAARSEYLRAMTACLEGRGYSVR